MAFLRAPFLPGLAQAADADGPHRAARRLLDNDQEKDKMTDSAMLGRGTATTTGTPTLSAVSWGAILAGAAGAAALSLILLVLGTGLGLASVSPFTGAGAGATALGVGAIVWIVFVQLAASGMGGYLAGRLRTRWAATHVDEVYFRDTAHGFLAWAIATLVTAATLTSAIGAILGTGASAAGSLVGGAATAATAAGATKAADSSSANGYFVDGLFRASATPSAGAASAPAMTGMQGMTTPADRTQSTAEAGRIFASGLESGALPADDVTYLGQMVSQRTGLSQADAEKRVNDEFGRMKAKADAARAAADKARKASAWGALWLFISLLAGAFTASLLATFGGRLRDRA
jgi:hypothetical protein